MHSFDRGPYRVRLAVSADDVIAAQRLRYHAFIRDTGAAPRAGELDADAFDATCEHVLVELAATGALVCCFRLMPFESGSELERSYSAQYYDLGALADFPARMVEMGRFCVHPEYRNPHVLRVAWQAMTRYVDDYGIEMLFGCSSFEGADAAVHSEALALLRARHIAPRRWLPRPKAPKSAISRPAAGCPGQRHRRSSASAPCRGSAIPIPDRRCRGCRPCCADTFLWAVGSVTMR